MHCFSVKSVQQLVSEYGQKLQVIRNYLEEEFSGHSVEQHDSATSGTSSFGIEKDHRQYELQIDHGFLSECSPEELRNRLQQWSVRDELCRAEGLPVILTERGVRLVSSN
jgi:hypothetical protein